MTHRALLLIAGMHRSGTSAVTGALSNLGAALPKHLLGATSTNKRGHFEPSVIVELHDRLLEEIESRWYDWLPIPTNFFDSSLAIHYADSIRRILLDEFENEPVMVLKDPRICRLIPLWKRIADISSFKIHAVIPYRDPLEVAASINARDGISRYEGVLCWLRHVLDAERDSRDLPRSFVRYDAFLSDWRSQIKRVEQQTGIILPRQSFKAFEQNDDFISSNLRNHLNSHAQAPADKHLYGWLKAAISSMERLERSPYDEREMIILDEIRNKLDYVINITGPAFVGQQSRLDKSIDWQSKLTCETTMLAGTIEEHRQTIISLTMKNSEESNKKEAELNAAIIINSDLQKTINKREEENSTLNNALLNREAEISKIYSLIDHLKNDNAKLAFRNDELGEIVEKLFLVKSLAETNASNLDALIAEQHLTMAELSKNLERAENTNAEVTLRRDQLGQVVENLTVEIERLKNIQISSRQNATNFSKTVEFFARKHAEDYFEASKVKTYLFSTRKGRIIIKRLRAAYQELNRSKLFDKEWYLSQYKDVRAAGIDPIQHYIITGFSEGRFPHPLFDTHYYLAEYPDVCQNGINPLLHYIKNGSRENRDPNPYFDNSWYRNTYLSGDKASEPIIDYWCSWEEGPKNPSPNFSSAEYTLLNPKPKAGVMNPLARFIHKLP